MIWNTPLVLVDFDGTLARLAVPWATLKRCLAAEAARHDVPWDRGGGLDANLRRIRREYGEAVFAGLCRLVSEAEYAGFRPDRVNLGLLSLLQRRAAQPCALVSANTRQALTRICAEAGFRPPLIVGKEDVQQGKPHPEGLLLACAHFGKVPAEALYIGDADHDARAAAAAGMRFVHVAQVSVLPNE